MADHEQGYLPDVYRDFRTTFRDVAGAYDRLATACRSAGPLSLREQRLVKLGIAIGLESEGGVRSHVRRGLAEGMTPDELLHAIALAIPTAGFPATSAAYGWANEVLHHSGKTGEDDQGD
jgi:4-carboxymuconolactone decarboxylase